MGLKTTYPPAKLIGINVVRMPIAAAAALEPYSSMDSVARGGFLFVTIQ